MQTIKVPKDSSHAFGIVVLLPAGYNSANAYPLVIFLAGQGGVGDGSSAALDKLINGEIPSQLQAWPDKYGVIIVAPQTGAVYNQGEVDYALPFAIANYKINPVKKYLTGLSLGGGGTWYYAMTSKANAANFAVIAPIATTWQAAGSVKNIVDAGTAVWAFHNLNDTNGYTPAAATTSLISQMLSYNPKAFAYDTIFNQTGHGGWGEAYSDPIPVPAGSQGNMITPAVGLCNYFLMNSTGQTVPPPTGTIPVPPPVKTVIRSYQVNEYSDGTVDALRLV